MERVGNQEGETRSEVGRISGTLFLSKLVGKEEGGGDVLLEKRSA